MMPPYGTCADARTHCEHCQHRAIVSCFASCVEVCPVIATSSREGLRVRQPPDSALTLDVLLVSEPSGKTLQPRHRKVDRPIGDRAAQRRPDQLVHFNVAAATPAVPQVSRDFARLPAVELAVNVRPEATAKPTVT